MHGETRGTVVASRGEVVSRRGRGGRVLAESALSASPSSPKRGKRGISNNKAKDPVMCCTKRERLGGLVHLP
eukprot:893619-Prorocentrum_minimum.AAC.1